MFLCTRAINVTTAKHKRPKEKLTWQLSQRCREQYYGTRRTSRWRRRIAIVFNVERTREAHRGMARVPSGRDLEQLHGGGALRRPEAGQEVHQSQGGRLASLAGDRASFPRHRRTRARRRARQREGKGVRGQGCGAQKGANEAGRRRRSP